VVFTGGVTGTATCPFSETAAAFGASPASHTNGLVRKFSGPVMTERHYYVKTADAHVRVWFYVRSYVGGAIEVETVVENGWLNVTGPTAKSYAATVNVGGTARYTSGTLAHLHHTRWSRVDWVGTAPSITPSHTAAYLRSTKLVPNYASGLAEAFFSNQWSDGSARYVRTTYATNSHAPTPFELKPFRSAMGGSGYDGQIGLLPEWDVAYIASGDGRAWHISETAGRNYGRYSFHYRDETTGLPMNVVASGFNAATKLYGDGLHDSGGGATTPTETGGNNGEMVNSHHPAVGYLQYLTTGRWLHLETLAFVGTLTGLWGSPVASNPWYGEGTRYDRRNNQGGMWVMRMQARSCGWAIRTTAQAAAIMPDGHTLKTGMETILRDNVRERLWYVRDSGSANSIGITCAWPPSYSIAPTTAEACWMHAFVGAASEFALDLKPYANLSTAITDLADVDALGEHTSKWVVGLAGTEATNGMNWRNFGWYALPIAASAPGSSSTPWTMWSSYAQLAAAIPSLPWESAEPLNDPDDTASVATATIYSATGNYDSGAPQYPFGNFYQSYIANSMPALAYANAHSRTGASAAYARIFGSATVVSGLAGEMKTYPVWAVT
jgi:hypothetical protein